MSRKRSACPLANENVRVQDTLAQELRLELQAAKVKWHDVLIRISQYQKSGLITTHHVALIRDGQKDQRDLPDAVQTVPEVEAPVDHPVAKIGRTQSVANAQSVSLLSLKQPVRNTSSTAFELSDRDDSEAGTESSFSDPSYTPWSRSEPIAGVLRNGKRSGTSERTAEDGSGVRRQRKQFTSMSQVLDCVPTEKAFPDHCPLCVTPFKNRKSLMQHLCGSGKRPIACPVRQQMFPVQAAGEQKSRPVLVSDSNSCSASPNLIIEEAEINEVVVDSGTNVSLD